MEFLLTSMESLFVLLKWILHISVTLLIHFYYFFYSFLVFLLFISLPSRISANIPLFLFNSPDGIFPHSLDTMSKVIFSHVNLVVKSNLSWHCHSTSLDADSMHIYQYCKRSEKKTRTHTSSNKHDRHIFHRRTSQTSSFLVVFFFLRSVFRISLGIDCEPFHWCEWDVLMALAQMNRNENAHEIKKIDTLSPHTAAHIHTRKQIFNSAPPIWINICIISTSGQSILCSFARDWWALFFLG